jgi:hypothetical protein
MSTTPGVLVLTAAEFEAYSRALAEKVARETAERVTEQLKTRRDPDAPLSPAQVAEEIDVSADSVYLAVRKCRLANHATPNPNAKTQKVTQGPLKGSTKAAKQPVLVRRGDAYALWPNKVKPDACR